MVHEVGKLLSVGSGRNFFVLSLSRVQFFVTPWTVACQVPLFMGILQSTEPREQCPAHGKDLSQLSSPEDLFEESWLHFLVCEPQVWGCLSEGN